MAPETACDRDDARTAIEECARSVIAEFERATTAAMERISAVIDDMRERHGLAEGDDQHTPLTIEIEVRTNGTDPP